MHYGKLFYKRGEACRNMHLESYNDVKKLHDQVNVSGLRQNRVTPYKKITGNDRSMGYTHKRSDIKKGIESY